jgi:hypothetical protein
MNVLTLSLLFVLFGSFSPRQPVWFRYR